VNHFDELKDLVRTVRPVVYFLLVALLVVVGRVLAHSLLE
jgi:hypothetical protein